MASLPPAYFIAHEQLSVGDALGGGASGVVSEARYYSSAAPEDASRQQGAFSSVAVKQVFLKLNPDELDLLRREVRILASMHHPNIVNFIGISQVSTGTMVRTGL